MAITPDEISRAKRYEGNVNHFYLDTTGHVTVGCGHLVANIGASVALSLIRKSDGLPATTADKQTEWTTIKSKLKGQPANYYTQFCLLSITQSNIDSILNKDLSTAEHQIISNFPNYSRFPQPAKAGLLDMVFNLGIGTLMGNPAYTNFVTAVHNQVWTLAASTCNRSNVGAARNTETKQLFLQAVQPIHTPKPPHHTPNPPHTGTGSTGSMAHMSDVSYIQHPIFNEQPASVIPPPPQIPQTILPGVQMPGYAAGYGIECQSIVAIVAMSSNVTTAAITAITAIATANKK